LYAQNRLKFKLLIFFSTLTCLRGGVGLSPPWLRNVYPLLWPSLTKDMQTEQLLRWSSMTDAEHTVQQLVQTMKNKYV